MFRFWSYCPGSAVVAVAAALLWQMPVYGEKLMANSLEELPGVWVSEGSDSKIELYGCEQKLCGKIVWLSEPADEQGRPWLDSENPDPSLRDRPIIGLQFLQGLMRRSAVEWSGGSIYDAESGEDYRARLLLKRDGTIELFGCWSVFCEGERWFRSSL